MSVHNSKDFYFIKDSCLNEFLPQNPVIFSICVTYTMLLLHWLWFLYVLLFCCQTYTSYTPGFIQLISDFFHSVLFHVLRNWYCVIVYTIVCIVFMFSLSCIRLSEVKIETWPSLTLQLYIYLFCNLCNGLVWSFSNASK